MRKILSIFKSKFHSRRFLLVISLLLLFTIFYFTQRAGSSADNSGTVSQSSNNQASDNRPQLPAPRSSETLNKEFVFPLRQNGKIVGELKYTIESAEVRNEIVVKGQKATAIAGRSFLILNLKLKNEGQKDLQINTRDYLRLSVNSSQDWLAPEIHNDPVEVQPISTKYGRVGFTINDGDKDLKMQIGEIDGPKSVINLNVY